MLGGLGFGGGGVNCQVHSYYVIHEYSTNQAVFIRDILRKYVTVTRELSNLRNWNYKLHCTLKETILINKHNLRKFDISVIALISIVHVFQCKDF
jgi:hypothetical protein